MKKNPNKNNRRKRPADILICYIFPKCCLYFQFPHFVSSMAISISHLVHYRNISLQLFFCSRSRGITSDSLSLKKQRFRFLCLDSRTFYSTVSSTNRFFFSQLMLATFARRRILVLHGAVVLVRECLNMAQHLLDLSVRITFH